MPVKQTSFELPEELREKLKEPFGQLIKDKDVEGFLQDLKRNPPSIIITVGDRTTKRCEDAGIDPLLEIVDNKEMRDAVSYSLSPRRTTIVENPAASITAESMREIQAALKSRSRSRIKVSGEEDLLVLPCVIYSPDGSMILYGQPGEGIVSVRVDGDSRKQAKEILAKMGWISND